MGKQSVIHVFFRFLFGLSLICLGMKGLYSVQDLHGFASQNIRLIGETLLKNPKVVELRQFSLQIALVENFLYLVSGCFVILGFGLGKLTAFIAVLIDIALIHNPYFYSEPKFKTISALYLGIFGAVLAN